MSTWLAPMAALHSASMEAFKSSDLAFARLLIRAGHNFALELLFNSVVRVIESNPGVVDSDRDRAASSERGQTLSGLFDPDLVQVFVPGSGRGVGDRDRRHLRDRLGIRRTCPRR